MSCVQGVLEQQHKGSNSVVACYLWLLTDALIVALVDIENKNKVYEVRVCLMTVQADGWWYRCLRWSMLMCTGGKTRMCLWLEAPIPTPLQNTGLS